MRACRKACNIFTLIVPDSNVPKIMSTICGKLNSSAGEAIVSTELMEILQRKFSRRNKTMTESKMKERGDDNGKAYFGTAPNGGYGWVIVAGSALTNVFNQSLVSVFGLLFADQITALGGGTSGAAWVMNLCSVCLNFSGLLTGPILRAFSPRVVTVSGALLTSLGLITSSISTQMWHLMFYALFVGIGLGLIQSAAFMAIDSYFTTRRGRAVGLAMAGTGLGQMLMPNIVGYLLASYSFKTATLALAALALNGVVGGLLFQPVSHHLRPTTNDEKQGERLKLLEQTGDKSSNEDSDRNLTVFGHISKILELDLLRDPAFCSLILGLALTYTSSINFSLIFPYYLQNTANLTRTETAYCMSVLAGADILSRLTFPTITDKLKVRCRTAFLFGTVLLIAIRSVLALTVNRTSLIVISAFYGFIRAMTVVNQNLTISEFCRESKRDSKLASALGLNMVGKGISVMTLGQLLGWVGDATQSYAICLHAQNVCLAVMVVLWTTESWCCRTRNS